MLPPRISRKSDKADRGKRSPAHRASNMFVRIHARADIADFKSWIGTWDKCWLWDGPLNERGYGYFCFGGGKVTAHRAAYLLLKGPICGGLHVLHSCDIRNCVNPDHLRLGTHLDNMRDMSAKGRRRGPSGEKSPSAKLKRGDVSLIRNSLETGPSLAAKFGVTKGAIYAIRNGKTWKGSPDAAA